MEDGSPAQPEALKAQSGSASRRRASKLELSAPLESQPKVASPSSRRSRSSKYRSNGGAGVAPVGEQITTVVRLRPRFGFERDKDGELGLSVYLEQPNTVVLVDPQSSQARTFVCDVALDSSDPSSSEYADQQVVFRSVGEHLIEHVFQGFNSCLVAYGQTGTGKTFTLRGDWASAENRGLLPRAAAAIFGRVQSLRKAGTEVRVLASCIEIYNNRLGDLLAPAAPDHAPATKKHSRLEIHAHPVIGVYVDNLSEIEVNALKDVNRLVAIADKLRHTAATSMNSLSSRSHTLFSFKVEVRNASEGGSRMATVQFVDLAGRENEQTSECKDDRFRELTFINRSLFHLASCINALTDGSRDHVPFRNSKLTMLLSESFQRNSRTYLLATLTPSAKGYEENLLTCRFLESAGRIVTQPVVNRFSVADLSEQLQDDIERMRRQVSGPDVPVQLKLQQDLLRYLSHSTLGNLHGQLAPQAAAAVRDRHGAGAAIGGAPGDSAAGAAVAEALADACGRAGQQLQDAEQGLERVSAAREELGRVLGGAGMRLEVVEAALEAFHRQGHSDLQGMSSNTKCGLPPLVPLRRGAENGHHEGGKPFVSITVELPPLVVL